jgi:hypothetical protein
MVVCHTQHEMWYNFKIYYLHIKHFHFMRSPTPKHFVQFPPPQHHHSYAKLVLYYRTCVLSLKASEHNNRNGIYAMSCGQKHLSRHTAKFITCPHSILWSYPCAPTPACSTTSKCRHKHICETSVLGVCPIQ